MRILDRVSGEEPPVASYYDRTSWPAQDSGPVDTNETKPSRSPADKPRDPIVKALLWLWREVVKSLADYAEVMYPCFTDPSDSFEHPPRQTDFRASDPHPAEMAWAIEVFPWSQPLPAKRRAPGFWARRRARRAMRAMMATLEFPDDRH